MVVSILFASLLGLAIEWVQPLIGRTGSLIDFGYNEIGILRGALFVNFLFYQRQLIIL